MRTIAKSVQDSRKTGIEQVLKVLFVMTIRNRFVLRYYGSCWVSPWIVICHKNWEPWNKTRWPVICHSIVSKELNELPVNISLVGGSEQRFHAEFCFLIGFLKRQNQMSFHNSMHHFPGHCKSIPRLLFLLERALWPTIWCHRFLFKDDLESFHAISPLKIILMSFSDVSIALGLLPRCFVKIGLEE